MQSREEIERWNKLGKSFWSKRTPQQKWLHEYLLYPFISHLIDSTDGKKVLDFGCTDGELTKYYLNLTNTNKKIFAFDEAKEMIALANKNIKQKGIILKSLGNRKFDIIVANMVFQDVYDLKALLKILEKHITKNGTIIASFPNPLHSSEKGTSPTARHQFLNSGEDILIERMYWSENENDWTYKYHRSFELYKNTFKESGFDMVETFFPEPIEEGKCNLELYEYNKQTQSTVVVLLRRE